MVVEVKEQGAATERVIKLKESFHESSPTLCPERVRFLAEAYQENEGKPPITIRARVYEKFLKGMSLNIDENPIVGNLSRHRVGMVPYPEYSCNWMKKELEAITAFGKAPISEQDQELLIEAAAYWKNRCTYPLTQEIHADKYNGEPTRNELQFAAGVWIIPVGVPPGRISVDYGKVLNKGLNGVIAEAQQQLNILPIGTSEALSKKDFLEAVIISCNAVIALANRYADLAADMAQKESDPARKKELEDISQICRWVPANPARTFREAIQSFWFTHLAVHMELNSSGISPGRFPQYMYPFYKKDMEEGRITREEVIELLELLFIKFTEIIRFWAQSFFAKDMGNLLQNISLGGLTPDGQDATNEMDYLMIEAQRRVRMIQPNLSILYHDKLPEELLLKATELVRTGLGMPSFFNADLNIESLVRYGASLEDARNQCQIGCVERGFSHGAGPMLGGAINMPKMLELALHDGKDTVSGKQAGLHTGSPEKFVSFQELSDAIKKQLQHFMPRYTDYEYTSHAINAQYFPTPFVSALVDDCIKKGLDVNSGGARYYMAGFGPVGIVDLGDSLAAIKKYVFEEKRLTIGELSKALEANFEGYEEIHKLLLNAPKYGNEDDYVDNLVREWYDIFYDEQRKLKDHLGQPLIPFAISVSWHGPLGAKTGALPSGRKAGMPLADGSVSASQGCDKNGPTALMKSASKAIDTVKYFSSLLNMKFHPSPLSKTEGLIKLIALIKTYMHLGGHHVQFNVVNVETLKDAQIHPENYKDLIVRVAGFSAYFIHLDPVIQNEIISRTELSFKN
jgi:formate C-acetyltransferase